ncbi:ABC transporter substrate-binding protein [Bacillus ndiopicus]|uniref:ABC transporter substrate-binding protein n=1 Tax=Bacillus ndiopicus TaxID=1347368 RepID=UPI0005A9B0E9|nr:ABC transporter substrate-binding protein [Bacillus ndiopicus]
MNWKAKWLAPLAAALLLTACGTKEETPNNTQQSTGNSEQAAQEGPYTVTDDRGIEVSFDHIPETIVSLQPSNTEILFSLGAGDKIIGATDYDNYPEEALNIERVSDSITINGERIIELNPDVVIAYTAGDSVQVEQLEAAGLKVFVIQSAASFDDVYGDIIQLSQVMGVEEKGEKIVEEIKQQIANVQEKTAALDEKKKVYFEIAPAPDTWSAGKGTFQQEVLTAAGVENVFAEQESWFKVAEEDVIKINPTVILTTVNYVEDPVSEIANRPGWSNIQAIVNKEIYFVDSDILSRPATRIGQAVELVAETVYPELFK